MTDKLDEYYEASAALRELMEERQKANEIAAENFWKSLSYEDKCNAFHAVVSRIFEGEIRERGTYRYVLYNVFGFEPDMYVRGMDCGFMALHNSIMDDEQFAEANKWMAE